MNQEELDIILENHGKWLRNEGGERANLRNAELKNTNLRLINLNLASLRGADLRGAYLRDANLSNADLSSADLRGADLSNAGLRDASLRGADLRGACLSGTDLRGAYLRDANLSNADLDLANWQQVGGLTVIAVQVDTSRLNNQIAYIKELDIWTTGCFQGTLDELKASVEQTHKHNEKLKKRYYRVIDFILNEVEEE
ncbi:pentapeptide repeat-containing protein [Listeria monocytogenes]|nr:pentapeptide repeat-containing protein [Listeria monocytogenes]EIM1794233.1 pentapeptide repeat-containing protein [Listeria monocytogenes]EIM1920726.1 pentapeptide repeat-containing protein [Listeria monocytogenes]EJF6553665.1 pentapeptide repeat-containing protein [Listeria monocytogenes]EJW2311188.1 pentapeptide repeat-containing protein [Listeria monocytogenes]